MLRRLGRLEGLETRVHEASKVERQDLALVARLASWLFGRSFGPFYGRRSSLTNARADRDRESERARSTQTNLARLGACCIRAGPCLGPLKPQPQPASTETRRAGPKLELSNARLSARPTTCPLKRPCEPLEPTSPTSPTSARTPPSVGDRRRRIAIWGQPASQAAIDDASQTTNHQSHESKHDCWLRNMHSLQSLSLSLTPSLSISGPLFVFGIRSS